MDRWDVNCHNFVQQSRYNDKINQTACYAKRIAVPTVAIHCITRRGASDPP